MFYDENLNELIDHIKSNHVIEDLLDVFHCKDYLCKDCAFKCFNLKEFKDHVIVEHQGKMQEDCKNNDITSKTQ